MDQDLRPGAIVSSLRGRDAGGYYIVLGTDGEYADIADGRLRRAEKPKKKKRKHMLLVDFVDPAIAARISEGIKLTNNEIRKALAAFAAAQDDREYSETT